MKTALCALSQREHSLDELTPLTALRPQIVQLIRRAHPELPDDSLVSAAELARFRAEYVQHVIVEDLGAVSELEAEVVRSMREHELLAKNIETTFDTRRTFGERLADLIASFGGSWTFIMTFGVLLVVWIIVNSLFLGRTPPDPYPFILLNLVLSCLAALQAPVIMMSQNRQESKDRLRAEHDYKVNLKAELEIRHLHEKIDFLLKQQSSRLFELQRMQIELMQELADGQKKPGK